VSPGRGRMRGWSVPALVLGDRRSGARETCLRLLRSSAPAKSLPTSLSLNPDLKPSQFSRFKTLVRNRVSRVKRICRETIIAQLLTCRSVNDGRAEIVTANDFLWFFHRRRKRRVCTSSSSSLKFLEWPKQQRHHEDHYSAFTDNTKLYRIITRVLFVCRLY